MIADPVLRARLQSDLAAIESKIEWWNQSDPFHRLTDAEREDHNTLLALLHDDTE